MNCGSCVESYIYGRRALPEQMNIIYNSENYYVVEYPAQHGYELVDKHAARSTFFQGSAAARFLESMQIAVDEDASVEHVDEFLDSYDVLTSTPISMH